MNDAVNILRETLSERQALNSAYSLRAFARDLGVSPQQLSNVMKGYRGLGVSTAERVAHALHLDSHQKALFVESFRARFSVSKTQRAIAKAKLADIKNTNETKSLQLDLFKAISGWHHMALVELIKVSKGKSTSWFSQKLAIPENEVALAIKRLERLELVSKTEKGWAVNQDTVIADQGIPNDAIKNYHRQILEKSIQALAFQGAGERYGSSSTMPIKVKSVDRAKKLIQKFRTDFAKEVSDPEGGEEIYGLSLQFFRLTQKDQETVK
jgi:uncharacterized protein (TIGR02147 family)